MHYLFTDHAIIWNHQNIKKNYHFKKQSVFLRTFSVENLTVSLIGFQVVKEQVFNPLSMNRSCITVEASEKENVALPYILRESEDDLYVRQDPDLFK